jgi:DNA-binding MarR family transcriptional regulator
MKNIQSLKKLIRLTINTYNFRISLDKEALIFQNSAYAKLVMLNIMLGHYEGKHCTPEDIVQNIRTAFGSRNSIVKCLKKAEKHNFIEKKLSSKDKRSKIIVPTEKLVKYFEDKIEYYKQLNIKFTKEDNNYFVI